MENSIKIEYKSQTFYKIIKSFTICYSKNDIIIDTIILFINCIYTYTYTFYSI